MMRGLRPILCAKVRVMPRRNEVVTGRQLVRLLGAAIKMVKEDDLGKAQRYLDITVTVPEKEGE